jgi:ketol-acid reductoisomerase
MEDYKKAGILENEFEAQLVASVLAERGIPHLLRSYHDTAFDGLFQTQKGWGYVSAPEEYHQEIKEILEDLKQGDAGDLVEEP